MTAMGLLGAGLGGATRSIAVAGYVTAVPNAVPGLQTAAAGGAIDRILNVNGFGELAPLFALTMTV